MSFGRDDVCGTLQLEKGLVRVDISSELVDFFRHLLVVDHKKGIRL